MRNQTNPDEFKIVLTKFISTMLILCMVAFTLSVFNYFKTVHTLQITKSINK